MMIFCEYQEGNQEGIFFLFFFCKMCWAAPPSPPTQAGPNTPTPGAAAQLEHKAPFQGNHCSWRGLALEALGNFTREI